MNDLRTVPVALLRQALEALENGKRVRAGEGGTKYQPPLEDSAIAALRAALAQQEQEPVARMHEDGSGRVISQRTYAEAQRQGGAPWSSVKNYTTPLYTHPAELEPPPEPLHEDKIRARYQELSQYCEPGDMLDDDWFEAGVRWTEAQHEIV
jgi:hypothetical protein